MRLYLIRHGETAENLSGNVQGRGDVPLSNVGREQAVRLRERLMTHKITAFYSSRLSRAHETAQIIAAPHKLPVTQDDLILELDFGELEGRPEQELAEFKKSITQPYTEVQYPGGEHYRDAYTRARSFLTQLRLRHAPDDTVVVVSHAAFMRVMFSDLLKTSIADLYQNIPRVHNTSLSCFELNGETVSVLDLVCAKHLE